MACFELVCACVSISSSNTMSDQKDCCSICLEPLHHEDPTPTCFVAAGCRVPTYWVWPCLHRVHTECITRSQASLRSIEASCFVCRWPAGSDARLHFERLYAAELSRVPVTARMSCHGAGECPGNQNDYGRASSIIEVCLASNTKQQALRNWFQRSWQKD